MAGQTTVFCCDTACIWCEEKEPSTFFCTRTYIVLTMSSRGKLQCQQFEGRECITKRDIDEPGECGTIYLQNKGQNYAREDSYL